MDRYLKNKKILFFSPAFFGYEQKIKDKYTELGAEVDMYDERSVTQAYQRAMLKVFPTLFDKKTEQYYFNILDQIKNNKYDYILFVRCDMPTKKVLKRYKKIFKDSFFCLHLWDSVSNIPGVTKKFKFFDYISSFDRNDCNTYFKLHFRPLFYCDEFRKLPKKVEECKYDLCFIGTIHSDRYKILKAIKKEAEDQKLRIYTYPYLQSHFIYTYYKATKKEFRDTHLQDFKYSSLSSNKISEIISDSRIVIDIQHPKQTGLTMRTLEMVGMGKKLMTTNSDIKQYDFYKSDNVTVIDRNNVKFPEDLTKEYRPLSKELYHKYSLEQWACEVINFEE